MAARLSTIAPDLAVELEHASERGRRRAAIAAVRFACAAARLSEPQVDELVRLIAQGVTGDSTQRLAVRRLAEDLDNAQWRLQDQNDRADAGDLAAHLDAFSQARAATAAYFAADEDAQAAALEAVYEAAATTDDLSKLKATVRSALA